MKKIIIATAIALSSLSATAEGLKPLAYPGSNWSMFTLNPGVIKGTPEDNNYLLQGRLEQGIIWKRFGDNKEWALNTYGALGYSVDKNGLAYNNKLVPAIGVKMTRSFENGVVDIGVQLVHENHFRGVNFGPRSGTGVQLFASYWFGWDLGRK